jgi:hypothetical protein
VVIVDGLRTAIGGFGGALKTISPDELTRFDHSKVRFIANPKLALLT